VTADVRVDLRLIRGDPSLDARPAIPSEPRHLSTDRAAADFGRRLALWLADVVAEAGRTPAPQENDPPVAS
jgi:hypothetical protein